MFRSPRPLFGVRGDSHSAFIRRSLSSTVSGELPLTPDPTPRKGGEGGTRGFAALRITEAITPVLICESPAMKHVIRLAIVDPKDSSRAALKNMLLGIDTVWLDAECSNYEYFADVAMQTQPDIALISLDFNPEVALELVMRLSRDLAKSTVPSSSTPYTSAEKRSRPPAATLALLRTMTTVTGNPPRNPDTGLTAPCASSSRSGGL